MSCATAPTSSRVWQTTRSARLQATDTAAVDLGAPRLSVATFSGHCGTYKGCFLVDKET